MHTVNKVLFFFFQRYYDEHAATFPRPILGSLSSSFSSSGSMSSMESPLRERSSTWSFVEVPPAIAENQTPSDCGRSAESGFHDMSRQASKTESSESAADSQPCDHALDEIIRQSAEYGESEHSRSSSDTVTPEDHVTEDPEQGLAAGGHNVCPGNQRHHMSGDDRNETMNQSKSHDSLENQSISHDNDSAVFEMSSYSEELLRGNNSCDSSFNTPSSYDLDFPEVRSSKNVTKEKSQTFLSDTMQMAVSDNIESVQNIIKHPSDDQIKPDGCIMDLIVSECKDDTSVHLRKQDQEFHESATECNSEIESVCEPLVPENPDLLLQNELITTFEKIPGNEVNPQSETYLMCDNEKPCDKTCSADSSDHCDHVLDGLKGSIAWGEVVVEGEGLENSSIEASGIDLVLEENKTVELESETDLRETPSI